MKNALSFLILLFLFSLSPAQTNNWAPIGAKWVYNYIWCSNDPYCGNVVIESVKDTVVEGKTCRLLDLQLIPLVQDPDAIPIEYEAGGPILTYEDSGKVYLYDNFNQEFFLLFDFTANIGDTIVLAEPFEYRGFTGIYECHSSNLTPPYDSVFCGPMVYQIADLDTIQLNGLSHIVQSTKSIHYGIDTLTSGVLFGQIVEGIGSLAPGMFGARPDYTLWGYHNGRLLCYEENGVQIYEDSVASCGAPNYNPHIVLAENDLVRIYPNPTSNLLFIEGLDATEVKYLLSLYNSVGELVLFKIHKESGIRNLDISNLKSGLFTISIHYEKDNSYHVLVNRLIIKL